MSNSSIYFYNPGDGVTMSKEIEMVKYQTTQATMIYIVNKNLTQNCYRYIN